MTYLSGYNLMWIILFFDLPVTTNTERKKATKFRNFLLDNGFEMVQFSVYMKPLPSKEHGEKIIKLIENNVPSDGKVDILSFTDKQYENIITFRGKNKKQRKNPKQYILFQPNIDYFLPDNEE